jgi:hypothetical protein
MNEQHFTAYLCQQLLPEEARKLAVKHISCLTHHALRFAHPRDGQHSGVSLLVGGSGFQI